MVTGSKEECSIFRQNFTTKADVKVAFDVLCGSRKVCDGKHLLPPNHNRLHALKIVASEQNINITYEINTKQDKKRKKRKRSRVSLKGANNSTNGIEPEMEQTPPDKRPRLEKRLSK